MFDLSKFMVGSDKESIKSCTSIKSNSLDQNVHNSERKDSATPPPKPPRIYDTVEGHASIEEVRKAFRNFLMAMSSEYLRSAM